MKNIIAALTLLFSTSTFTYADEENAPLPLNIHAGRLESTGVREHLAHLEPKNEKEARILKVVVQHAATFSSSRTTLYFMKLYQPSTDRYETYVLEPVEQPQNLFKPGPIIPSDETDYKVMNSIDSGTTVREGLKAARKIGERLYETSAKLHRKYGTDDHLDFDVEVGGKTVEFTVGALGGDLGFLYHHLSEIEVFRVENVGSGTRELLLKSHKELITTNELPLGTWYKTGKVLVAKSDYYATWSGPDPFYVAMAGLPIMTGAAIGCAYLLKMVGLI